MNQEANPTPVTPPTTLAEAQKAQADFDELTQLLVDGVKEQGWESPRVYASTYNAADIVVNDGNGCAFSIAASIVRNFANLPDEAVDKVIEERVLWAKQHTGVGTPLLVGIGGDPMAPPTLVGTDTTDDEAGDEDDAALYEILAQALDPHGYKLVACGPDSERDVKAGLAVVIANPPDDSDVVVLAGRVKIDEIKARHKEKGFDDALIAAGYFLPITALLLSALTDAGVKVEMCNYATPQDKQNKQITVKGTTSDGINLNGLIHEDDGLDIYSADPGNEVSDLLKSDSWVPFEDTDAKQVVRDDSGLTPAEHLARFGSLDELPTSHPDRKQNREAFDHGSQCADAGQPRTPPFFTNDHATAAWLNGYDFFLASKDDKRPNPVEQMLAETGRQHGAGAETVQISATAAGATPAHRLMKIKPQQLATILQQAAQLRTDVKRARIAVEDGEDSMLWIDVDHHTPGRRLQRQASIAKINDTATCGEILTEWIGAEASPPDRKAAASLLRERENYLNASPYDVLRMKQSNLRNPPPPPTRSKFDWKNPRPTEQNPTGVLPDPIPEQPTAAAGNPDVHPDVHPEAQPDPESIDDHHYVDKATGEIMPKMTRSQMVANKMTKEQRHEQYRRQGGRHPSDDGR